MPSPTVVFARLAARLGGVDPTDRDAVVRWYREELPNLSPLEVEACWRTLLDSDLTEEEADDEAFYAEPDAVPLPRLRDTPPTRIPPLARLWWTVFGRP